MIKLFNLTINVSFFLTFAKFFFLKKFILQTLFCCMWELPKFKIYNNKYFFKKNNFFLEKYLLTLNNLQDLNFKNIFFYLFYLVFFTIVDFFEILNQNVLSLLIFLFFIFYLITCLKNPDVFRIRVKFIFGFDIWFMYNLVFWTNLIILRLNNWNLFFLSFLLLLSLLLFLAWIRDLWKKTGIFYIDWNEIFFSLYNLIFISQGYYFFQNLNYLKTNFDDFLGTPMPLYILQYCFLIFILLDYILLNQFLFFFYKKIYGSRVLNFILCCGLPTAIKEKLITVTAYSLLGLRVHAGFLDYLLQSQENELDRQLKVNIQIKEEIDVSQSTLNFLYEEKQNTSWFSWKKTTNLDNRIKFEQDKQITLINLLHGDESSKEIYNSFSIYGGVDDQSQNHNSYSIMGNKKK